MSIPIEVEREGDYCMCEQACMCNNACYHDLAEDYDTQSYEFTQWWNELDEDDRIMLHSLAIYMALGGKLNAFNVQETGVDINGV